jgi:hypothetical protein
LHNAQHPRTRSLHRRTDIRIAHARLNERLREWTLENDLTYVDTIAALDARRDVLMSWVHLNAEGNRLVAEALVDSILAATCNADSR